MIARRRALAVLLAGAGIAGCGSSSGPSPSAYRARVDALCAAGNAKITALPSSDSNSVAGLETEFAIEKSILSNIKRVKVASTIAGPAERWLATVEHSATAAGTILAELKRGDVKQAQADAKRDQAVNDQGNREATALKLAHCAENVSPSGS